MKNQFRKTATLAICLMLIACGQAINATQTPSEIAAPTITPSPSQIPTTTVEPTPRPTFVRPTLIPTIDPMLVPDILLNTFFLKTLEDINGYKILEITGWNLGFGGGLWQGPCSGYYWLDTNHILLYPAAGQVSGPEGYLTGVNVAPQPVVMNLESGAVWLPPVSRSTICRRVYWSRDLALLITSEIHDEISTVSTYTYDGHRLSNYAGGLLDVSPSKAKILVSENTVIDLQTGKKIKLNWSMEDYYEPISWDIFWTSDENRIYRCCYFYADLASGASQRFERSEFHTRNGNHLDSSGLWFYKGQWVRNDTHFLVEWSWVDDGDIRYLPLFDPEKKIFYDVRAMAGISEDWTCYQTSVSPDGAHVWMVGGDGSYLVNLFTFASYFFPGPEYLNIDWSPNGEFAWAQSSYSSGGESQHYILSVPDKKLKLLPITPIPYSDYWHPVDNVVVYQAKDRNSFIALDPATMSFRELPFKNQTTSYQISDLVWSPNGEKIAFVTNYSSLWLVDYPSLENLENIVSAKSISTVSWSPDGNSIAFIGWPNIYIVETRK